MWTTLPFGWNESPFIYLKLSEACAQYVGDKGIPALAYVDDSWIAAPQQFSHGSDKQQWLGAAQALRFAASVVYLFGYYLSLQICDLVPSRELLYLGVIFDSRLAAFRVPQDTIAKLRSLLMDALNGQRVATLERMVVKCMTTSTTVQSASL